MKKTFMGSLAAAALMVGGLGMVPVSTQLETQSRALEAAPRTTPRRGGSSGGHRSPGDRAHKRMKRRRAASHHGA